jgi:hypothetical protein
MVNPFFCSEMSFQVGEDPIGSAIPCQTYILVECPLPWTAQAFESKAVPQNLRELVQAVKRSGLSIRFLLINQGVNHDCCHVIVYHQPSHLFLQKYQRLEWTIDRIEQAAPLICNYLSGRRVASESSTLKRDLLICVHGSHDKCCAKYGLPFYRQALSTIAQYGDPSIRLWQTSHFGGHRFAPTLIDLPEGRYYGRLDQDMLRMMIMRSGDLHRLSQTYRGWSLFPQCLQPLERDLILHVGWSWFDAKVAYQIIGKGMEQQWVQTKVFVEQPNGTVDHYQGMVVKDAQKTVCIRSSCSQAQESEQVKYTVKLLRHCPTKIVCFS